MPIEWRDRLSVGNDMVDDDHKALIGIVNEFEHALTTKDAEEVEDVFRRLLTYTEEHFEREEALQTAIHFPERKAHKEEHLRLKWALSDIHEQFVGKEYGSLSELKDLLRDWLLHHIVEEDMKMAPYLKGGRG